MIHSLQKRWVCICNACKNNKLPPAHALQAKLNFIIAGPIFKLEIIETMGRKRYQGRLKLLTRSSKKALLKIFSEIFEMSHLTIQVKRVYDNSSYCEKLEIRVAGLW